VIAFVAACSRHHDETVDVTLTANETVTARAVSKADVPPAPMDGTGGGASMRLDESKMAREDAREHAQSAGILGSSVTSSGFASLVGSNDISTGFDDTNVYAGRKIIHGARVELVVLGYDAARRDLESVIKANRGYIASTAVHHRQGTQSDATIAVRVPAGHVQPFVAQLAKLGEVVGEATQASEITADYTDTAARLASAKTLEKRLLQLVAEGRGKIEDVLPVERELARVRGDIEALEAKIRQWDDLVAMASISIELTTKRPELPAPLPPAPPTFGDRADGAFPAAIDSVRAAGVWLALTGISVFPWLVLAIPGIVLLRPWTRRIRLPWAIARRVPAPADEPAASPGEAVAASDSEIPPS
jgi:hypothetical protein